jgi:dihydroxy-acid dehydratase
MPDTRQRKSLITTAGPSRSPNRAMLRGVGFTDDDFEKPVIGVASLFSDITPCNAHLDRLAQKGREGIRTGGGVPQTFGAPTVSDGISMGHPGMRYSLVSREVIADCIETVCGAMNHDGLVAFGGCDKNMPGCTMAMARLNIPSVFVYGGSILPGVGPHGEDVDIVSIFEAVGKHQAHKMDDKTLHKVECESCPGHGSCGGMYTANTMASAIEALGLSLPHGASNPAVSAAKEREAYLAGIAVAKCIEKTSSLGRAWRTLTRLCWLSADRPMPCCTSWPLLAKPASIGRLRISTVWGPRCRTSPISSPAASTSCSISTELAARPPCCVPSSIAVSCTVTASP